MYVRNYYGNVPIVGGVVGSIVGGGKVGVPGTCKSKSLSLNNCNLLCFSNTGDTIQWIKTKVVTYWSFIEKTSVKQSIKCKVCSNFQMQMYPSVEASGGQEQYYIRSS